MRETEMHPRLPFLSTLALLPSLILAACSLDIATPNPKAEVLPEGLEAELTVDPAEVAQHAPFTVRLSITNTTADTIRIVTSDTCLARPKVTRGGRWIPFKGSILGCGDAIWTHSFAPGETTTRSWKMRAELWPEEPGDPDEVPAPRGTYIVVAELGGIPDDRVGDRPMVSAPLRVR
jgi:hypothetical protein